MPELVRGDVLQASFLGSALQLVTDRVLAESLAVVGEQELRWPTISRVRQRPAGGAGRDDPVDQVEGLLIERDHPFGVELAEGHLQPGALLGDLVDGVELEIEQFPDP